MQDSLIGRPAPDFEVSAVAANDRIVRQLALSSFAGRWLILMFYPRDFSFVCPTELTAFSAHIEAFRSRHCDFLALSVDSIDDHLRWFDTPVDRGGIGPLRFPLGSDLGGLVSRAYGVWMDDHAASARGLFIIDPAGILQYAVVHNASVGRSSEETLRVLDALQSGGLCPASWTAADGTLNAEEQLQAGRVLGHFRIVEKLGAGAFGSVFAADDLILDRRVAIKIIGRHAAGSRETVLAEARAAAKLHHPHICTVFAVETIDAIPVIVMEYVHGQVLSEFPISRTDVPTRIRIARGIAAGLADAHANGVIHGDLKPGNIMISQEQEAKLLDFGLAKRLGSMDGLAAQSTPATRIDSTDADATVIGEIEQSGDDGPGGRLSGTPAYMSPEQTRGEPASTRSDVYAFGLIFAELLAGRRVVREENLFLALDRIRSGAAREAALSSAPDPFRNLIGRTLAAQPEDRPAMSDVIEMLSRTGQIAAIRDEAGRSSS